MNLQHNTGGTSKIKRRHFIKLCLANENKSTVFKTKQETKLQFIIEHYTTFTPQHKLYIILVTTNQSGV
jgi:hypothetical protein